MYYELHEDLLQLNHKKGNLIIDLGWYPAYDANGKYILMLVRDYKWDFPLEYIPACSAET